MAACNQNSQRARVCLDVLRPEQRTNAKKAVDIRGMT